MKIIHKLRRGAPVLIGAVLTAASVSVSGGGTPAMARAVGGHHPSPARVRADMLALLGHHGAGGARVGGVASAAAAGVPAAVPMPGTRSNLSGVFCTSAINCWAVGSFDSTATGATLDQVLHWNGSRWSQDMTVPSPGGTAAGDFSELDAVRCRTASDCWAVGDYADGAATLNLALHWNGTKWSKKSTPDPGGSAGGDDNMLFDVVCPGASTCWAAGEYGSAGGSTGVTFNQLLHWNGSIWTPAKAPPQPAGTGPGAFQGLGSIRCTSTASCLAVGTEGTEASTIVFENEALRWNGTKWSTLTIPSPSGTDNGDFSQLSSLACTSATDCWAAGSEGTLASPDTRLNQIMSWDGTVWTQDTFIDDPDGNGPGSFNELNGITCRTATDCWAVGDYGRTSGGGAVLDQALHWTGEAWSTFTPTGPDGASPGSFNSLNMVRCTSATRCWAVGEAMTPNANQALRWNGTQWSIG